MNDHSDVRIESVENGWIVYVFGKDVSTRPKTFVFTCPSELGEFIKVWGIDES